MAHSRFPSRLPGSWVRGDFEFDLVEVDHQTENIQVQRAEDQAEDVACALFP